jgi:hypothetical protein
MYGAYRVWVDGQGVTGEIVAPDAKPDENGNIPNLQAIQVRFTVTPDAPLGVRDYRIATPRGVSTLGQLVIVRDPVVAETEKNNSPDEAVAIPVPCTVCGTIGQAEDVDYYRFSVPKAGQWSFHVRSMRLQDRIHDLQQHVDPILTLRNAAGTTVAASDNYFFGDPFLSHQFASGGEYLLEIRDVRYQGNRYWEYSIEISPRPFVTNVHPVGVVRGEETNLELIGCGFTAGTSALLRVPPDVSLGPAWLPLLVGEQQTNPAPVVVGDLPVVLESGADNNAPETGQAVSVACGISGRIESESDIDYYTFEAEKDERLSFEVFARRLQSGLDSHLRIVDTGGRQLAVNDDMRIDKRTYADSRIENWTAPADAKYALEIRDLHLRGGETFVYFLRARRAQPHFDLFVDTDKTQLSPGTSSVIYVRVERKEGFEGDVQLGIDGLPPGVSAACGRILAGNGRDGCIVLTADADAEMAAGNVTISGTAVVQIDGRDQMLTAVAKPYQETYQPGGGRGHWPVAVHTVSVGDPGDIRSVTLSETEITLKPGESKRVGVRIERAEGFDKNVTLDVQFRHLSGLYGDPLPPGIALDSKNSKTLLTGTTTEGHITLIAAKDAQPIEKQQIAVMANVAINFVMKSTYTGPPLLVTVAE